VGYWKSLDDIRDNWAIDRVFSPEMDAKERHELLHGWHKAVRCALTWADEDEDI
jgi:glycerol kinase